MSVNLARFADLIPLTAILEAFGVPYEYASAVALLVEAIFHSADPPTALARATEVAAAKVAVEAEIDSTLHDDMGI